MRHKLGLLCPGAVKVQKAVAIIEIKRACLQLLLRREIVAASASRNAQLRLIQLVQLMVGCILARESVRQGGE